MTDSGQSSGSANPRSPGGNRLRWQTQVDAGEPENLLPRNVEAERGVLGTMLLRPGDVIPRVATVLKSSDLFLRAHRIIFSAILKIHQAGETVTIMSLTSELRGRKALEEVGGATYVAELLDQVTEHDADGVETIAKRVKEASTAREAISVLESNQTRLLRGAEDPYLILADTEAELHSLKDSAAPTENPLLVDADDSVTALLATEFSEPTSYVEFVLYGSSEEGGLPGYSMLAGAPGAGKSWFVYDLAIAVASGTELYGFRTTPGRVGIVTLEIPAGRTKKRLMALGERTNLHDWTDRVHVITPERARGVRWDVTDATKRRWLIEWAKDRGIECLVIDPLANVWGRGLGSESGDEAAAAYNDAIDEIRFATNASVLVTHHTPWENARPRGHSSLIAPPDAVLTLIKASGEIRKLEWTKPPRYDVAPPTLMLELLAGGGFVQSDSSAESRERTEESDAKWMDAAENALREAGTLPGPELRTQVIELLGVSQTSINERTFGRFLGRMAGGNGGPVRLICLNPGGKPKRYQLPDGTSDVH